ncbi:MAG: fibronectin type III domain-containing protein [Prosthecobacter sp.]|uniref:fibronectin type III domain-containing protein n=1 Tax=Prosthecobacter sp. TaxID=1965333 RepID=UPI0038FECA34
MNAKIKLDITDKDEVATLTVSTRHTQAMAEPDAAAFFTTPVPTAAAHAAAHAAVVNNLNLRSTLKAQLTSAEEAAPGLLAILKDTLRFRVTYVQLAAKGDPAKIVLAGFDLAADRAPVGDLPAPINFEIGTSNTPGTLKPHWKPVPGARSYILEFAEHATPLVWAQVKVTTTSRTEVPGLTSGKTYAFRVRAVGASGEGPWSDEAVKMAP